MSNLCFASDTECFCGELAQVDRPCTPTTTSEPLVGEYLSASIAALRKIDTSKWGSPRRDEFHRLIRNLEYDLARIELARAQASDPVTSDESCTACSGRGCSECDGCGRAW